jgi:hypothetical protein
MGSLFLSRKSDGAIAKKSEVRGSPTPLGRFFVYLENGAAIIANKCEAIGEVFSQSLR